MTPTELISSYYAAFNSKNWQGMLDKVSDDVRHHVNEGGQRDGKGTFAEFLKHMDECYDEQLADIVVMVNATGTRASAEFLVRGTYKGTDAGLPEARGQGYVLPAGAFFEIHAGKIARVTTYYNLANWLKQIA